MGLDVKALNNIYRSNLKKSELVVLVSLLDISLLGLKLAHGQTATIMTTDSGKLIEEYMYRVLIACSSLPHSPELAENKGLCDRLNIVFDDECKIRYHIRCFASFWTTEQKKSHEYRDLCKEIDCAK
jgi:hypothetical protein